MEIIVDMNKLVSITLCTFNSQKYIHQTIQSVINQTYKNIELIIIDDGSTDNTINILNHYKKNDDRIKVFLSTNNGLPTARNLSFKYASGEIIGIIDHDDICKLNRVEKIVDLYNRYDFEKNIGLIFSDTEYINSNNAIIGNHFSPFNFLKKSNIIRKVNNSILLLTKGCYIDSESVFFKKEIFDKIGLMDPSLKYACDFDFFIRVGLKFDFLYSHEKLAQFRIHPNQQSNVNPKRYNEIIYVYKKYLYFQTGFFNKLIILYRILRIIISKYK